MEFASESVIISGTINLSLATSRTHQQGLLSICVFSTVSTVADAVQRCSSAVCDSCEQSCSCGYTHVLSGVSILFLVQRSAMPTASECRAKPTTQLDMESMLTQACLHAILPQPLCNVQTRDSYLPSYLTKQSWATAGSCFLFEYHGI